MTPHHQENNYETRSSFAFIALPHLRFTYLKAEYMHAAKRISTTDPFFYKNLIMLYDDFAFSASGCIREKSLAHCSSTFKNAMSGAIPKTRASDYLFAKKILLPLLGLILLASGSFA